MNPVEIEEAVSALAEQPFDAAEFPYAFLEAFANKETTIRRLRSGATNKSDLGGVLQTNHIHIAVSPSGQATKMLAALRDSPATAKAKARFILATDGTDFEAEDLVNGKTVASAYRDFPDHFGFFLPLAGITTIEQISENAFDIRATSRLNRLYVELLKDNPVWGTAALGGKFNSGLLYTLNKSSGKEKPVYSFCHEEGCTDGIGPVGPVVPYAGTLIGAVGGGDGASDGLIYRIGVNNKQDVLYAFCQEADCTDGAVPLGVIVGPRKKLFGVTQRGGKRNDGVVFELAP